MIELHSIFIFATVWVSNFFLSFKNIRKIRIFRAAIRKYLSKIRIFQAATKNYLDQTNFFVLRKQTTTAGQSFQIEKIDQDLRFFEKSLLL